MLNRIFYKMSNNKINLSSYNNVEKISNFKNKYELNKYRKNKLNLLLLIL